MARAFRATIWYLNAGVAAVEGYAGERRYVVEHEAEDEDDFKAMVTDASQRHVDDEITFGPVSEQRAR